MQGLGMNDGDKGGGTAGAQAKLETTKMILLAVLNLLDQPSYSVDRLHRLALLAARKAKETFEYIKKQLLISPNSVALWKMMRTVVVNRVSNLPRLMGGVILFSSVRAISFRSVGEDSSLNDETISNIEAYVADVGSGAYTRHNSKTALFRSLDSLSLWSASNKSAFKKEEGFIVVFNNLSIASPFSSTTEFHGLLDTIGDTTYAISASSSLLACPTVITDADEHDSLLREIVYLMTSGPLCVVEPIKIGIGEADDVTLPDEPAERLGIVRHGHADELGAADQGERHAIGDKATKDGAGAGGRASGGVDFGCGDAPSSRRVQHGDARLLPAKRGERARSDSRMDGDICGAGQRAGVAGVEHRTADHSASSGTDAEQARNMNDMLC
ncbi:hypothetical protein BLNAU_9545 [Blattamonas nauphoetae]|uniref:Uncharacterized protein n=1 Tax=Blattamonas nauphoetae TaxID=2049346 RepID=A0ABQ9XVJ0_9EUKA|nr:hypothetical protein BLNAU_9545 [Blattamonas nauphoetae]